MVSEILREDAKSCKIHYNWLSMYLNILQNIRRRLLSALAEKRFRPMTQKALGTGAAGDKTFPVDNLAEDIIISELEASGIALSLVSEERGLLDIRGGGKKVLIDPVDGSTNAVAGIPFYCTSVAVAGGENIGSIEFAYVVNLVNGDEFWADKGKGAFLNNEKITSQKGGDFYLTAYEAQSPGRDISRILPLLSRSHKTRCLGATALDLAYLACGSASVFVNPSASRSFDFAGGWLLTKEAGGIITDLQGGSIEDAGTGLEKTTSFLASGNQMLHEKALELLNMGRDKTAS